MSQEKTEWLVSALGKGVLRSESFRESKYSQARELYTWWLVRYPDAEVTLRKITKT